MHENSVTPAAPAVASLDPVEWTRKIDGLNRRINDLEGDKQSLEKQVLDLKSEATRQANAAASARGAMKPMREEIYALRANLAASDNLKELGQLRAEVAKLHKTIAQKDLAAAELAKITAGQIADLTHRANRAEGKFQALEATASMMAASRDKANASATTLLTERDEARKRVEELLADLAGMKAELVKAKAEAEKAQAEAKALRQAPQVKEKS